MAEFNVDEVIESGKYDLALRDDSVWFRQGDEIAYTVVEGGQVQEDGTVPIVIRISLPPRYRGRVVKAALVPKTLGLLAGTGVVGLA